MRIETAVVHAGEEPGEFDGALVLPVFQSSTYLYAGQETYESLRYIRLNNTPNHRALHQKLAALEGGESGLVAASGMAAISATLLSLLQSGDHLLAQSCLYGATRALVSQDFAHYGIDCDLVDPADPESWKRRLRPNTRVFLVEAISNPLVRIGDLPGVVEFCRQHGLVSVIDNTFATPVNFRPVEHGFDLVVHSCTKYLNGHSDIVAGAVIGSADRVAAVNRRLLHWGGALDPHACFLLQRGIRTLVLRVRQQNQSALQIARFLESHPAVARVYYPGLDSSDSHPAGRALFQGFGGMLSFELHGSLPRTQVFLRRLRIPVEAPSLGGPETLVTRPATTSHSGWSREERQAQGIQDHPVRMSVGIEAVEDLLEDLERALQESSD
jgi:cystathionine beta-lyase/cystathionine gamma-synthase